MLLSIKSESFITSLCQLFGFSPYFLMHHVELEGLLLEQRNIPFHNINSKKSKCSIWPGMIFEILVREMREYLLKRMNGNRTVTLHEIYLQ